MLNRNGGVRWVAACLLACLSIAPVAIVSAAAQAAAQTDPPPPSQAPSFSPAQRQGFLRADGFSPSYWPIGLWNTPGSSVPPNPSFGPSPSPSPYITQSPSTPANAGAFAPHWDGSAAPSRRLQAPDSAPPTASLSVRPAHLESQSVPTSSFVTGSPAASSSPHASSDAAQQNSYAGPPLITNIYADTAPAVAGPATPPPSRVAAAPSPAPGRPSTVTVTPGAPSPAPVSPSQPGRQQSAPSAVQAPSPSASAAAAPTSGQANATAPTSGQANVTASAQPPAPASATPGDSISPSRNPFAPGSQRVASASLGTSSPAGTIAGLGIPTLSPNATGTLDQAPSTGRPSAGSGPTSSASGPTVAEGQPPLSGATGLFPNATAAAPAPSAVRNPYNTLPDGTQLSSLSAMVVELLLTGQQLYPFTAASQYDVASSVNGLLKSYPHLLELSNIGIVAVITPDTNGSANGSNAQPDLALIGIPVASPYPMAPAPAPVPASVARAISGSNSSIGASPAAAPAAVSSALPGSALAPPPASRTPPATTPAPAAAQGTYSASLGPVSSGRRRLLAQSPSVTYDVGGAQHVAINLTISAADYYMQPIQRTLNESIRAGSFLQTVNSTGLNLEKVEIVLIQQIRTGAGAPAPAPGPTAPAPLAQKIIGLPITPAATPSSAPALAPVQQSAASAGAAGQDNKKTIIIAVVCVVGAAAVFAITAASAILWHRARRNRKVAKSSVRKHDSEEGDIDKVEGNGFQNGGWGESERGGGPGGGKQRGPAGVVAVRTDGGEQGASYSGISPDSVGAGHDLANGLASPARRHPSGVSEWGTGSDGTNLNSRDQLLSHNKGRSSMGGNASPHGQGRTQAEGRPPGLNMYDSAAETGQSAQRSSSNGALGRNGSGPGMHDFARQGTLAGDASLPSDGDTPHRNGSTPNIGRLQRIGAAQLWQVNFEQMQIQKQIGEGSFGKVYLAKWKETTVAVKILSSSTGSSDDDFPTRLPNPLLQSLEKEASMMAAMRHPNVVLYLGVCLDPPCVVTEYCARGSLNDVLKRALHNPKYAEQLDWRVRLSMALDAAKGMNYLHTSDPPVIHRDLKSPNLLVDKHWRVKVCDFNLSRVMEESAVLSSMAATNPRWLAPEILAGRGYTFSSDVYSFGIILWEFLTWRVPWHEYGPWQVVAMVTDGHQRPEIPQEGSRLSSSSFPGMPEYVRLMQSCWEQEAKRRPTFAEIIQVLRKLFGEEARRNPAAGSNEANLDRVLQASTSGGSGDMSQKAQQALLGSSGELQNGHRQGWAGSGSSGEGLQQLGGLRFTMNPDRRSGSGQHLPLGSPGAADRSDAAALSGSSQHGRSESMGSEAHLQAYVARHASGLGQESGRVGESPRGAEHVHREGSGLPPLARREGQDGSGQLSSNGDWPGDPRERLAAAHAISDTSSQHDHAFSPPDSRTHSLRDYAHPLPPVGEGHDEREHSGALDGSLQPDGDPQGSGAA